MVSPELFSRLVYFSTGGSWYFRLVMRSPAEPTSVDCPIVALPSGGLVTTWGRSLSAPRMTAVQFET